MTKLEQNLRKYFGSQERMEAVLDDVFKRLIVSIDQLDGDKRPDIVARFLQRFVFDREILTAFIPQLSDLEDAHDLEIGMTMCALILIQLFYFSYCQVANHASFPVDSPYEALIPWNQPRDGKLAFWIIPSGIEAGDSCVFLNIIIPTRIADRPTVDAIAKQPGKLIHYCLERYSSKDYLCEGGFGQITGEPCLRIPCHSIPTQCAFEMVADAILAPGDSKRTFSTMKLPHEWEPMRPSLDKPTQYTNLDPSEANDPQSTAVHEPSLTHAGQTVPPSTSFEIDELTDELKLQVKQIIEMHTNMEFHGRVAVGLAWNLGTSLNSLHETIPHGEWGPFKDKYFSDISTSTIRRYRALAKMFTLTDLEGLTLTDAYASMSESATGEEAVAQEDEESGEETAGPATRSTSVGRSTPTGSAKILAKVKTAAKKFHQPESLTTKEKDAVFLLCVQLEEVTASLDRPTIVGLNWRAKLQAETLNWSESDREVFRADFFMLQGIWAQLEEHCPNESRAATTSSSA